MRDSLPVEVIAEVELLVGDLDGRELVVMAVAAGGAWVCAVTEQEWERMAAAHEVLGSRVPVGVRFRRDAQGGWVRDAGWDIRPR